MILPAQEISNTRGTELSRGGLEVQFVTGSDEVARLQPFLTEFAVRCGQAGAMQDLGYFLGKPGAAPRTPHLLLVSATGNIDLREPDPQAVVGVLLVFEQKILGIGSGAYATNDRSGRNTLIGRAEDIPAILSASTRALLKRRALLILLSVQAPREDGSGPLLIGRRRRAAWAMWTQRVRRNPAYLRLAESYDATLATIGQKTRSNLRYYRRRAESALGCRFFPEIEVSRDEILAFNRECMFAASQQVAGWRYDSLGMIEQPVLMGIKDRDGRWLSILAGRRYRDRSEILWQMNRDGLEAYSLSAVMRSYFIEHEIGRGAQRMYIEGGTVHPLRHSFVEEDVTDLMVVRRSLGAKLMQRLARRYISRTNELSHMIGATDVDWQPL